MQGTKQLTYLSGLLFQGSLKPQVFCFFFFRALGIYPVIEVAVCYPDLYHLDTSGCQLYIWASM